MSRRGRWERWERYTPAPKKPPPKRGIKMKKSGSTWWGERWVDALERLSYGYSNRLARGRTYARAGRTHDLVIQDSRVTAKVTGSRAKPYRVTISLARLSDDVWDKAIRVMAEKAQFSAELLAGQMPQQIDAAFQAAGASIFPVQEADLTTDCSCPDWANPCKHVAATHYVLGEAFDRDPFLVFELRGRSKSQLLEALRAARAKEGDLAREPHDIEEMEASSPVPSVSLGRIKAADWDRPPEAVPPLRLSFELPTISGGVLRQLGAPSGWSSDTSPADALGPVMRAAAERARAMAMAETATEQDAASEAPVRTKAMKKKTATKPARAKRKAKSAPKRPSALHDPPRRLGANHAATVKSGADAALVSQKLREVPPAVRGILVAARRALKAAAPQAEELACAGSMPRSKSMMWKLARYALGDVLVAGLGTFSTHSAIFFYRGRELDDGSGLLQGSGKQLRFIRLRTPAEAASPAVKRVVRKAFSLAAR